MLGIQQTHPAAPHHPTTRSAATAAAVSVTAGQLRSTPVSKRRPLPKQPQQQQQQQQILDTVSTTQDNPETHAEAAGTPAENSSAWPAPPRDEQQTQPDEKDDANETGNSHEAAEEQQNGTENLNENQQQDGEEKADEQGKREENEEREGDDSKQDGEDDYTRHPSSPLSELSPAPDEDESPNQGEGSGENEGGDNAASNYNTEGQPHTDALSDPANSVPLASDGHATSGASQINAYTGLTGSSSHQTASAHHLASIDGPPSTSFPGPSSQFPFAASTPPTSSPAKSAIDITHTGQPGLIPSSPLKADSTRKFSVLLELNAELSRVCQAFVASGYSPHEIPEAQPFVRKLGTNLTWMSAHVDGVKLSTGIPDLEPPVLAASAAHIAFPDGIFDRINSLYGQLSAAFSKDIMRRNSLFAQSSGAGSTTPLRGNSATPSSMSTSSIGVKRERPDSAGFSRMESPTAPKRRDTGEGKEFTGPNTPTHSISGGSIDMPPPTSTGFSTPTQPHMNRPGSSMRGISPMSGGMHTPGQPDGVFSPSSSSMNMNSNLQGLGNIGGLSPGAQARARQMQIQQAQAMMLHQQQLQQQQGQHHQQMGQQQSLQQHLGGQGANMSMGSPQRPTQGTPSPTRQQQMMQAQAAGARQMSPGSAGGLGAGMGMGMNGTDGVGSSQQGGMTGNMQQPNMNANVNGVGSSSGTNMTLNPQVLANMGPNAMAAYQALQNPQHNMTQLLNQQMPGFSQLPMMEQMRRFQIIQQRQIAQRNQMMSNQMMGGQMRPPNMNASGSGNQQMLGQGGQMGTAPQLQSSTSEGSMQFPGTPTSANMGASGVPGMGMQQQISGMGGMQNVNMANMNPQQRQLYLMQMQMRNAGVGSSNLSGGVGAGMNPAMMNPQLLQERQRLEQQQRLALAQRHGSPLNPGPNASRDQFPPGLRSNPTPSIGISRTGRSPSVSGVGDMAGAATPRIGGRMLPGSEDYQRQALLQQAQRNAQMQQQQQGFMQGQGQGAWPGQQSQQLPLPAGAWPQQSQQSFGMGSSTPTSGMSGVDFMSPSRQASATPAPMGHQSPTAPSNDFGDMMNW